MEKLKSFIMDNHHVVMEYHSRYYRYTTCLAKTPYDRIRALFLSALEASGAPSPLDRKYRCYKNFLEAIKTLKGERKLSFESFAGCFVSGLLFPRDLKDLAKYFVDNEAFPTLGSKKANLFIKELVMLTDDDIFLDIKTNDYLPFLRIPIDKVIRKVYCTLKDLSKSNSIKYDNQIQNFAKSLLGDKSIYFDDLWFWGHFAYRKNELLEEPNQAMIYTDRFIDDDFLEKHNLMNRLNLFIQVIKEFKQN